MTDLATLGLAIDARPAAQAATELDRLVSAAGRAERAASGVGQGFDASGAAMARATAGASQMAAGLDRATRAANENARAVGLTRHEFVNLSYQLTDIAASAASGASAFTILAQQGGQIAPVLAQAGSRLSGVFGQVVEGATSAAARVGLVGGAIGGIALAVGAGAYAWMQYAASQQEAANSLRGVGAASGATAGSIDRIAEALARAQGMSVSSARSLAGSLASNGRIDVSNIGAIAGLTRGTAGLFGEDAPEAASRLAGLFAEPTRGADVFNQKLGVLTATQRRYIEDLERSGQVTAAQRALIDVLEPALARYGEQTGVIARGWQWVKSSISDATDALGHWVDRAVTGGSVQERLAAATQRYLNAQRGGQPVGSGDAGYESALRASGLTEDQIQSLVRPTQPGAARTNLAAAQSDLEELNERARRASQAEYTAARTARQVQASQEVDTVVKALNPGAEKLREITAQAQSLRDKLAILPIDEQGRARATMQGLETQAAQIAKDLETGGQRFADQLRAAQQSLSLVGASAAGRGLADANEQYRRDVADLDRQNLNPVQRMVQERTLQEARDANLARVRAETSLQANQSGGAFSRAPAAIQSQILDAVGRFPTVDPAILAGLLEKESGFTVTGPTRVIDRRTGRPATSAWGLGQITDPAATDIRKLPGMEGFDKYNVETQVLGAAAYLSIRQQRAGQGNIVSALNGYGTGPGYGVDVLRRAGRLGDASQQASDLQVDAAKRAADAAGQQLQNVTENYGKNTVALEANQRATEQINAAITAGRTVTGEFAASIRAYETAVASAARQTRITQFGVDTAFEEAQLGRTAREQVGYARARSVLGETGSPEARAIADRTMGLADLREARATFQDTAGSFASSLLRGASAAQAASDAFGRLSEKILNMGIDQIGAALFSGGSRSGFGGFLSGIFGGGGGVSDVGTTDGPGIWFANGGVMTNRGQVPLHRYATGGVATSPQVAIFGEGRGPEAYVPLPDGRRIPVAMQQPANSNMAGGMTDARNFNFDMRGSTLTEAQARAMFMQALAANNQARDATIGERFGAWRLGAA